MAKKLLKRKQRENRLFHSQTANRTQSILKPGSRGMCELPQIALTQLPFQITPSPIIFPSLYWKSSSKYRHL
ncbi:hypothetical protein FKM82_027374 [Ascaphus truei]